MSVRFDILTIFPGMFRGPLDESMIRRAVEAGLLTIEVHDIRQYATDRHRTTDDYPFGGGAGMVMKAPPIVEAVEDVCTRAARAGWPGPPRIIILTPAGRRFTQAVAEELAHWSHLILICGHYEGIDERVHEHVATDEISIGDYILTGGELPAMVLLDAVARLVPGVLGAPASLEEESISSGLLEYPQYTRPAIYRGWTVPEVLLSGNHQAIARWRRAQALERTFRRRPDLLRSARLTRQDGDLLSALVELPPSASDPSYTEQG